MSYVQVEGLGLLLAPTDYFHFFLNFAKYIVNNMFEIFLFLLKN